MGISSENKTCNCKANKSAKGDDLLTPIIGKMKVLKKIKRRMGLASKSGSHSGGTNNLPPLQFHNVHGDNIRISREGTVAKRVESFCKGIAFSSRPIKVNEKICVKFVEISNNWSGVLRFGFTYNDPSSLRYGLPKYACPDLTNKPGYWAKALPERFCSPNTVLFYYVTSNGDVHFGINDEEKGIFFGGVETREPLWALIDVYGNSTAVEFVDIRHQLNNSRRLSCSPHDEVEQRIVYPMAQLQLQQQTQLQQQLLLQQQNAQLQNCAQLPQCTELQNCAQLQHCAINQEMLRYQPQMVAFHPMMLHRTKGRNARFGNVRNNAYRTDTEFCQGYVFTARPVQIGERVVVQILATEPMFQGCLGLGLTSCDPATLQTGDLPDDANFLLDRPEYWVLSRDFARNLNKGDEISFCVGANGEVHIYRNGDISLGSVHVDQTLRLWAFFDIYGSTQRIRVLSAPQPVSLTSPAPSQRSLNHYERRNIPPTNHTTSESMNSLNSQSELRIRNNNNNATAIVQTSAARVCCVAPADIQVQQATNGSAVLSVILPHASFLSGASTTGHLVSPTTAPVKPSAMAATPVQSGTMISTCSSTYVEPISDLSNYSTPVGWMEGGNGGATVVTGTECTICYENSIDAVLYMCGHMCMCYECALQQWRGKGGGHCPLCRAVIRDVIRTYKS